VEEQRVNVVIDFAEPPEARRGLGDAYRVEARIVIWEGTDVLKAPAGAVFRDAESWAVFAIESGRAVLRHIDIGKRTGREVQALSGLEEGDRVVVYPGDRVRDGVRVRTRRP
jgi:HlyD family secretion protein